METAATLTAIRSSTDALQRGLELEQWSDGDVQASSLLPGWSRGHVLTHIARNADGITATLAGALRGEVVARYPDGPSGRNADIEAGAGRPVTGLLADVRDSADRLDGLFAAIAEADAWEALSSEGRAANEWPLRRWREVEIHRVDLDGTYTADQWPAEFVEYLLPLLATDLGNRTGDGLTVEVAKAGSVSRELPGRAWTIRDGGRAVTGPDWALLAWLLGRPTVAARAIPDPPDISRWL